MIILKEINDGRFESAGIFWYSYYFHAGKFKTVKGLSKDEYNLLLSNQRKSPQRVMNDGEHRIWWMFQDRFYVADSDLHDEQIKALILEKQNRKERIVKKAMMSQQSLNIEEIKRRDFISDEVKMFVWKRDEGKCVKCSSQNNLEFDHIIPISKGGSSTERNLQLLCEKCNRSKHDSIV